ncbi:MAG TPA: hypothetical protein VJN66_07410 [Rhodanobacteraceae bacterium]|nr:hypothetical protein [Rhodanobacteraceae bacterium]
MHGNLAIGWYALFAVGMALPAVAAAKVAPLPKAEVEQAVIAAIPAWQGRKATVLKYLDLTRPFDTASPWTFVVAQDPKPPADPDLEGHGPIATCLVKALVPRCTGTGKSYPIQWPAPSWYFQPYELSDTRVVYGGQARTKPLLLVKTCSGRGGDGNCNIQTDLYRYLRQSNLFHEVFTNESGGSNNNQAARFVESGPLQGDVIVDYPTDHAPYTYWIEVYAPGKSDQYERILRYRSVTHYGDGNPLPVADSEMPAILQRLGVWKLGDALPVPQPLPANCGRLVLNRGEEWCRNLCVNYGGNHCNRFEKTGRSDARDR